jgi:hypothetical protein
VRYIESVVPNLKAKAEKAVVNILAILVSTIIFSAIVLFVAHQMGREVPVVEFLAAKALVAFVFVLGLVVVFAYLRFIYLTTMILMRGTTVQKTYIGAGVLMLLTSAGLFWSLSNHIVDMAMLPLASLPILFDAVHSINRYLGGTIAPWTTSEIARGIAMVILLLCGGGLIEEAHNVEAPMCGEKNSLKVV